MRTLIKYLDESLFKNQEQIKRMVKSNEIEFVDLGLSVKWAKCNLGAEKETDSGHYYMWGSTTPNDNDKCCWGNAPFNNGQNYFDNEYFSAIKNKVCPNGILATEYDAAYQESNGDYRMPTNKELNELISDTKNEWIENYKGTGINGRKFTNKYDSIKFIFIPAVGYHRGSFTRGAGNNGSLWSASLNGGGDNLAHSLYFNNYYIFTYIYPPFSGFPIRPICDY